MWEKRVRAYLNLKFFEKSVLDYKTARGHIKLAKSDNTDIISVNQQGFFLNPRYNSTSISKMLNLQTQFEFQFLRKNKIYNKGRYSRCRQNYRTGVYMCMYLSILSIFGLYY